MTSFKIKRNDSERVVSDVVIEREELRIGSQQHDIDLLLNHPGVSPIHATVREIAGQFWIYDTLDMNPTLLDGRPVSKAPLNDGNNIQIGPFILHFDRKEVLFTVLRDLKANVQATEDDSAVAKQDELDLKANVQATEDGSAVAKQDELDLLHQPDREAGKLAISTPLYPAGVFGNAKARFIWTPTADLKPPIIRAVWLTRALTAVTLLSIGALFFCSRIYSPGPLASAHSRSTLTRGIALGAVSSCSDCHQLFGRQELNCADCHKVPSSPGSPGFDPAISGAHLKAGIGCVGCHTDHNGRDFMIGQVDNRSCMSCHNDRYESQGKPVGTPHKNSAAKSSRDPAEEAGVWYVRDDKDVWTWKDRAEMKLTGDAAKQSFHKEHPYARTEQKCNYCHLGARGTDIYRLSPRTACQACHAVSFDAGQPKAIGSNCATCHKQHGKYQDLEFVLDRMPESELRNYLAKVRANGLDSLGDTRERFTPSERGGASVKRQGLVNWSWAFVSRLGVVPWHIWTGSIGMFALGGTMLVAFGNVRRKKYRREASAHWRLPRGVRTDQERESSNYLRKAPTVFPFPIIDDKCIGCHACIDACPHEVLAMSKEGRAMPLALDQCMDDTGCQEACPTQACKVANTAKKDFRVLPAPERDQNTYMTNEPGLYVIGEVARNPLIKSAVVEGARVIDHIEKELKPERASTAAEYGVAIIGAGPAGLSAALRASEKGIAYVVIEQNEALATIKGYPTGKRINLTIDGDEPAGLLPLPDGENSRRREELLSYWDTIIKSKQLIIFEHEYCERIERGDGSFTITTLKNEGARNERYIARKVVLAIGRNGPPSLDIPGMDSKVSPTRVVSKCQTCDIPCEPEQDVCSCCNGKIDRAKVKYKLDDPARYNGRDCVVVGGGNSAVEAAVRLTGLQRNRNGEIDFQFNNRVTLAVRKDLAPDLKLENKMDLYDCVDEGKIDLRTGTVIKEIKESEVILMNEKLEFRRIANDYVFCCIGTQWPREFLTGCQINIQ